MRTKRFCRLAIGQVLIFGCLLLTGACLGATDPGAIADTVTPSESLFIDACVRATMQADQVPAGSLALVRDGQIVYLKTYGQRQLANTGGVSPASAGRPANIDTRFAIGSVSKEFTAAAILLLSDRGKLSLDDPVAKYLPELTDAKQVTIRQLLGHTSGYQDYFTQEYIPPQTQQPTAVNEILKIWAQRPLDFSPGSQWQYSGTNFVIAGRIVEIVTGEPYEAFLTKNILEPVGITDATVAEGPVTGDDAALGYYRFALGPRRPAPRAGRNWLFAMADLVMTARDVALWDISVMKQTLLSKAAYEAMSTEGRLNDGKPTGYGLGFFLQNFTDATGRTHRLLHHPGEISGFRSHNYLVPDAGLALAVLTNAEYSDAASEIARQLQDLLGMAQTPAPVPEENAVEARARRLLAGLAHGTIDRGELAPDASEMFTPQAISDIQESLIPLGRLQKVKLQSTQPRGGMNHHALSLSYELGTLQVAEYDLADGRIEQFFIDAGPRR